VIACIVVPGTETREIPSSCPRHIGEVHQDITPGDHLDVESAVLCVYPDVGRRIRAVLPERLVLEIDRDYATHLTDEAGLERCFGNLEPFGFFVEIYGTTASGRLVVLRGDDFCYFRDGQRDWLVGRPLSEQLWTVAGLR
jgi:hypothetical protein